METNICAAVPGRKGGEGPDDVTTWGTDWIGFGHIRCDVGLSYPP